MKKRIFIRIISALLIIFLQSTLIAQSGSELCSQNKINNNVVLPMGINITPHNPFNILHYKVDFDLYDNFLAPYPKTFNASEIVTFRIDTALNSISLDAVNTSLSIDSVGLAAISFIHDQDNLYVQLDNTYQPYDTVNVQIFYHHLDVNDQAFFGGEWFCFYIQRTGRRA